MWTLCGLPQEETAVSALPVPLPESPSEPFFVAGGTVPVGSAAYVTRRADEELFQELLRGEFCYILTSRQMGKSSLMARTAARLRANGLQAEPGRGPGHQGGLAHLPARQ